MSRATGNSVKLRWAPTNYVAWSFGNQHGYSVVRYTFDRSGENLLKDSTLLTLQPLKPLPLPAWEPLAKSNRYAAITAQALYGESFQLEEGNEGQAALINQNTEQENRFSFALASADQSLEVAEASGLYFEDKTARPGTEYVYRVKLAAQQPGLPVLRGSVIASPSKVDALPQPDSLHAEFGDGSVRIHWNSFFNRMTYNYYVIERSEDGKVFSRRNELNFLQLIPTSGKKDYNLYYMDSLANDKTYHYRVRGITAFGEEGPPSNIVSGEAHKQIRAIPGIRKSDIDISGRANINWYFPDSLQNEIKGFYVARGTSSKGPFANLNDKILPPSTRAYSDSNPLPTNYYVVRAESVHGQLVESMPMLVQSMDSIPPAAPTGITGKIDSVGNVLLTWATNKEPDLEGYKVFRSYHKDKDYVQAHRNTIAANEFVEKVQLKNLTKDYYYQVVAVDRRSNASAFSAPVLLKKPDVVPPSSPLMHKPKYENGQVMLSWTAGTDEDLAGYRLYRQDSDTITMIASLQKTQITYQDATVPGEVQYLYKVIAFDDGGLVSDTASYNITVPDNGILPTVKKITYAIDQESRNLTLNWKYDNAIDGYILYRSLDEGTLRMVGRIPANQPEYIEKDYRIGRIYKYRIQAYKGEKRSPLSDWIKPTTN